MSKYIDTDKLIFEIERRKNENREFAQKRGYSSLGNAARIKANEDEEILSIIASLQQDRQEADMKSPFTCGNLAILSREEEITFRGEKIKVTRKYYRCVDTGREFTDSKLDDDMMWAAFRAYCEKKGMTSFTDIMLKQEQQEVDLEKEIEKCLKQYNMLAAGKRDFTCIARHFYELGLNARKL